jgi:hypothetical protein
VTTIGACALAIDLLRELAAVKAERDGYKSERDIYRGIATAGIHHGDDLQVENQRIKRQDAALREEVRHLRQELKHGKTAGLVPFTRTSPPDSPVNLGDSIGIPDISHAISRNNVGDGAWL